MFVEQLRRPREYLAWYLRSIRGRPGSQVENGQPMLCVVVVGRNCGDARGMSAWKTRARAVAEAMFATSRGPALEARLDWLCDDFAERLENMDGQNGGLGGWVRGGGLPPPARRAAGSASRNRRLARHRLLQRASPGKARCSAGIAGIRVDV